MLHALFTFPGLRYHATPWQSHVNEGAIEWPPSPWRLCRALIATGYTKLGWEDDSIPSSGLELIESLAGCLPEYRLPQVVSAHTRHWMPVKGQKTTKVFDSFAYVGQQGLGVSWPVTLPKDQVALFETLVTGMGYLGRAESWVAGERVEENELPDHPIVRPCQPDEPSRRDWEQVQLIAPVSQNEYLVWRARSITEATEVASRETGSRLTAARLRSIERDHPSRIWSCLTARTHDLQKQGWNQPPGSRYVLYWRRADAVVSSVVPRSATRPSRPSVECALLALASDTKHREVLPHISRALPQAELLHQSLLSIVGSDPCPELSGRGGDGTPLRGHKHSTMLPLDLDGDGRLDHILLHARMGLGSLAQSALEKLRRTWTKGEDHDLFVSLVGLGSRDDIRRALSDVHNNPKLLDLSDTWRSHTPFIAPRFIKKGRNSLQGQIESELAERGFPKPVQVKLASPQEAASEGFLRFVRARRGSRRRPPSSTPWLVEVQFPTKVPGPIALGYGCHYGLGVFRPLVGQSLDLKFHTGKGGIE